MSSSSALLLMEPPTPGSDPEPLVVVSRSCSVTTDSASRDAASAAKMDCTCVAEVPSISTLDLGARACACELVLPVTT
jgi:hypothetical protein